MIPKIIFRYSWIYDRRYRESKMMKKFLKKRKEIYPSIKKISQYIEAIEKLWKKDEKRILKEISKVTGLKWKDKQIICYVNGMGRPFSDPLTLRLYKNKNDFIDTLTHELIHQIQIQNRKKYMDWSKNKNKKYKTESVVTNNHIFLHAVHKVIYLKFFNKSRLNRDIKDSKKFPDYKRSWDIVEEEGHENIINQFKKLTK